MAEKTKVKKDKIKVFPNNLEAEQSLLCCILIDGNVATKVVPSLDENAFYNLVNRKIFAAMKSLYDKNFAVDMITVNDRMVRMGFADENTLIYLTDLVNMLPSGANFRYYLDLVRRDYILRMVIESSNQIIEKAYSGEDARLVLDFAEKNIFDLSKNETNRDLKPISEPATELMDRLNAIAKDKNAFRGLSTGLSIFDKKTNGLQKGDLIILAARPSVGKSAFALNIVSNIARRTNESKTIAIYSLEMPAIQLAQRLLCNLSNVTMDEVNNGELIGDGKNQLWEAVRCVSNSKIFINDASMTAPEDILSQCRRLSNDREKGIEKLDLIIVDYLQLMSNGESGKREESRQNEVAKMSRMMKIVAKEMNCPLILLSQMSRGIENRQEKNPQLSDLRESGAIEQDADIVMFLSREDENDKKNSPIILNVAKHRNGELFEERLNWYGEYQRFTESDNQSKFMIISKKKNTTANKENSDGATDSN